jgi:hypothetical protein
MRITPLQKWGNNSIEEDVDISFVDETQSLDKRLTLIYSGAKS